MKRSEMKLGGFEDVETSQGTKSEKNGLDLIIVPVTFIALPVSVSAWKRNRKFKEVVLDE